MWWNFLWNCEFHLKSSEGRSIAIEYGCDVRDGQEPDCKSGRFPDKYVAPLACYRMLTRPRKKVTKFVNQGSSVQAMPVFCRRQTCSLSNYHFSSHFFCSTRQPFRTNSIHFSFPLPICSNLNAINRDITSEMYSFTSLTNDIIWLNWHSQSLYYSNS